jgi:predicted ATPase/class 3 adenylate cyclase
MEALHAFIPIDRRLAMARGQDLPDRTNGAVLFADISGFTPLTAALAQELGVQRGAEEVLNQINPVYEALIAELYRYGGSVMGFAGDSITCWLDGDDGHGAVACALAMQAAMRPFTTVLTPAGTPITLAIKVAVAVGNARRFIVGDPTIQVIDVLAGRTLDLVAQAEHMAMKGDVVVGEGVVQQLGDVVRVREWRVDEGSGARFAVVESLSHNPEPRPHDLSPATALTEEQVRPFVLPPVYERLKSSGRFLAELRPSVALFLKFGGIDYDADEAAGEKLHAYIHWLQGVLAKHEGYLIQLTIGDKGSYLYASFGAPVAHGDDDERAVAAALELRVPPAACGYICDVQIGISRGRVWAGQCGARVRNTYGVMGNEVNMAARLMGKALPGQILVRRRIADRTAHTYAFNQLGLMTVKGGAEPIPVAELLGKVEQSDTHDAQFSAPLVGREAELRSLERLLDGVLAYRGQIVSLEGPTGIGKSHLVSAFQQRATANGIQLGTGACQRIAQSTAYYPWQQILRQILGLPVIAASDYSNDPAVQEQVSAIGRTLSALNPTWQVRLPLLGDLFGLPIPDNPTTAAFEPRQRQETLLALVVEILRTWSRSQPVLIAIDNAHWMDEASQALTEAVAKALGDIPVMLLIASRPAGETEAASVNLSRFRHYHAIQLGELPPEAIASVAEHLLGAPMSLLARALVIAKSQGNPFYTRELVDSLRESGQIELNEGHWILSAGMIAALRQANVLVQDQGTWVLAEAADLGAVSLGIPDSVHGIILARIDRLPETHKPTLKVASVVGYTFELGLLAQVHPAELTDVALESQAEMLEQRDFILHDWQASTGVSSVYSFRQQATQEVAYETLLYTQRRELHRSLALALEQQAPDSVDQIAYHAFLGEDWALALLYQLQAGRRSKQLFANLQSIEHYLKAAQSATHLPLEDTLVQRQEIHAALGELQVNTGQLEAAGENLRTALSLAEELADPDAQAQACRWIARAYELQGQYQPALEWIDRGLNALGERVTPAAVEMRLLTGLIQARQGNYQTAHDQAESCLLAAEDLDEASVVARAHNLLGLIARLRGHSARSVEHFQEALRLYQDVGNLQGQALSLNQMATACFNSGEWTEAADYYRQAGNIFTQLGDVYNRLLVDNNLGGIALNQGRLDDALGLYRRALTAQEQLGGSLFVRGALHLNLGATHVRRGEADQALEQLRASQELFELAEVRELLPEMHRHIASARLVQGDLDAAAREAELSTQLARDMSMLGEEGQALRIAGEIALRAGRKDDAGEAVDRAVELLGEVQDEYGTAQALLLRAELNLARGQTEASLADLARVEPVLERLDAVIDLAFVRSLREKLA